MACSDEVHLNDIGTDLVVTVNDCVSGSTSALDVSGASTKQIILEKPSGDKLTKTASFTTDGTDGKIQYTTKSGDLDEDGEWRIQAKIVDSSGTWYSSVECFTVYPNL